MPLSKRLVILLVALLALAFAVQGCGGDDDEDDKPRAATTTAPRASTTEAETATSTAADAPTGEADAAPAPGSGREGNQRAQRQIAEACKKRYRGQAQTSANVLEALDAMCDEGAARDQQGVREANKEVCRRIVQENAPADQFASGRAAALRLCDQR